MLSSTGNGNAYICITANDHFLVDYKACGHFCLLRTSSSKCCECYQGFIARWCEICALGR